MKHKPGRYSAEVSELTGGGEHPFATRIYPDASDVGFVLLCADTGREVRMVMAATERNNENEVLWWTLKSDDNDVRRLKIHPIEITVYND
jgi:hypothetical protein